MIDKLRNLGPVMWLAGNWQIALAAAGGLALAGAVIYFVGRDHGYETRVAEQAAARVKADALEDASAAEAAKDREADKTKIEDKEGERNAAIVNAGEAGAVPSSARNALNCQRMRQAGRDVSQLPACGGRAPRSEAGPGR